MIKLSSLYRKCPRIEINEKYGFNFMRCNIYSNMFMCICTNIGKVLVYARLWEIKFIFAT